MVVCKYFLQGTCKFGSYCNYEHQAPSNYTSFSDSTHQSSSILRQANFGSAQPQNTKQPSSTGNVDVNTLVKSVVNDMAGAEKGGQWLLSCYAPFKEKPAFPGFEDHSPEEIRLGFYEAQNNATVDQYKAQLQALLQNSMIKLKALQNPSQDIVAILQSIYNTPPSSCSGTYGQNVAASSTAGLNQQNSYIVPTQNKPFGQSSDNIFKSNTQPSAPNIFAQPSNFSSGQQAQAQTNIFANSVSSPTQNQNLFPANTFTKPQNNIFANQPASNIFVNQTQNVFSPQTPQATSPSSVFSPPQQTSNIFKSTAPSPNQNLFAPQSTNQPSIFGQQSSQQTQQNIFTTQNLPQNVQNQNIFSAQSQQQQNIFSSSTNSSQFSNSQQTVVPPPNYSASIFGNSNPSIGFNPGNQQQSIDESLYSKLEELDVEERKWFESDSLDIMNIPDKPPTYDMCFKV